MEKKFAVNDYVIYGKSGLCVISEIKAITMAKIKSDYYVLNSVNGNPITLYVPCDNEKLLAKLRYPMSKSEIDEVLESAKGQTIEWIDNNNIRNERFKAITDSDNYRDWLLLTSCLHLKKQEKLAANKHLSTSDENTLRLVEKLIEEEFCYSLELDKKQVAEYIQEKLGIL